MSEPLKQVLYVSQMTRVMSQEDLADLLSEARSLNGAHGITGVLVCVSNNYVQFIEGPCEEIDQLCANIEVDPRNKNFLIVLNKLASERCFPDWKMGFKTYTLEEFSKEDGFMSINEENDLETIKAHHEEAFQLMLAYYRG